MGQAPPVPSDSPRAGPWLQCRGLSYIRAVASRFLSGDVREQEVPADSPSTCRKDLFCFVLFCHWQTHDCIRNRRWEGGGGRVDLPICHPRVDRFLSGPGLSPLSAKHELNGDTTNPLWLFRGTASVKGAGVVNGHPVMPEAELE